MNAIPLTIPGDGGLALAATWHRRDAADAQEGDTRAVIVAVHGYPDDSHVWDALIPHLLPHADVLTYDVRGCGRSDAPAHRDGYALEHLAGDLDAVVREADSHGDSVHVLAHDWGSIQAWHAVTGTGESAGVASFTTMSGPCLDHAERWIRGSARGTPRQRLQLARQLASSSYIAFFKAPFLAEATIRTGLLALFLGHTGDGSDQRRFGRPAPSARDQLDGLNLYRANMLTGEPLPERPRTTSVPTLALVSTRDRYVRPPLATCAQAFVPNFTTRTIDAGHWAVITHPEAVAEAVLIGLHR